MFSTGLTEIHHRPAGGDLTLITFGNAATLADGRSFWASGVADALDLDCIGFMPCLPHWYPEADMAACVAQIAQHLAGRRVVLYGDSMGAYAAIRHARLFRPAAIIAVAPQRSIDPADVPDDTRFHHFFRPHLHAGMAIAAAHRVAVAPLVIHDPLDRADFGQLQGLQAVMPVVPIPLFHTGHQAVHMLSDRKVFARLLTLALAQDPGGIAGLLRQAKKPHRFYLNGLGAAALTAGHRGWADAILGRARAAGTSMADILWLRAHAHRRAGRWAAAEADARASLALPDANPARRADLWELLYVQLRSRGRAADAAALCHKAMAEFAQGSAERTRLAEFLAADQSCGQG